MGQRSQSVIFFTVLAVSAALLVGGVFYFGSHEQPSAPVSSGANVVQSSTFESVETIPTSTIIANSSSSISQAKTLALPYTVTPSTANEIYWPKAWGNISFTNDTLALIPDPTTNGANSFLNGASAWGNYDVNTNVSWLMGGWFDIVARVSNNTQNFVYCEFGSNGTEIIERVNAVDTQLAFSGATSTSVQGSTQDFGMQVYGNDISCSIGGQEVVGVHVENDESNAGGIGFVIFGQPAAQQQVTLSNVSVTALTTDTIIAPFSFTVAAPVTVTTPPPTVAAPPAPTPVAVASSTPPPAVSTAKTLPYFTTAFNANDWIDGWGGSMAGNGVLTVGANASNTSGGIFLAGSNGWTDYNFTADLDLVKGTAFDIVARRTDNSDFIECIFSNLNSSVEYLNIDRISNGQNVVMGSGETFIPDAPHIPYNDIQVSMEVRGINVQCSIDGATVDDSLSKGLPPTLMTGGIGFITWDPAVNNSQIIVNQIDVIPL